MPRAITCILSTAEISFERALFIRDGGDVTLRDMASRFVCIECGKSVRPHKEGGNAAAHFEHLNRNADCPLSHKAIDEKKPTA